MAENSYLSLSQLQERIKTALSSNFDMPLWITAEISEIKINSRSGHCYLQLVEKGGRNGVPQAQASAVIWAAQFGMLASFFHGATGQSLEVGMRILVNVRVTYHELYGLSLNIIDIDPLYTLGDLEQQRLQTIERLKEDGVFDLNRESVSPEPFQRIALISSSQAAGYRDFMKEIQASPYRFEIQLFEAVMQGHGAENSIIAALDQIVENLQDFDAVVIVRGGGSRSDLSFLDSYLLSFHIAQFPLPVVAGLGHDKDTSVVDLVAAFSLKTPTAAAMFLSERAAAVDAGLQTLSDDMLAAVNRIMSGQRSRIQLFSTLLRERLESSKIRLNMRLDSFAAQIDKASRMCVLNHLNRLENTRSALRMTAGRVLQSETLRLDHYGEMLSAGDPLKLLARGYAIVRSGGKTVTNADELSDGDILNITLNRGTVTAKVQK